MLAKLGIEPISVDNGQDAVDNVKREVFDIILMDCELPRLTAMRPRNKFRKPERALQRKRCKIVALTGHVLREQIDKCTDACYGFAPAQTASIREPDRCAEKSSRVIGTYLLVICATDTPIRLKVSPA